MGSTEKEIPASQQAQKSGVKPSGIEYLDLYRAVGGDYDPIRPLFDATKHLCDMLAGKKHSHEEIKASAERLVDGMTQRRTLVQRFAWALPSPSALRMLARYAPIVEMGAGTGYWASLLRAQGVDIVAYDETIPGGEFNHWHKDAQPYTDIVVGSPRDLKEHADRALFLCWPPYQKPMAYESVKIWKGKTLLYIGEGEGGCTADDRFFRYVGKRFEHVKSFPLPQWFGIHDRLEIYERL